MTQPVLQARGLVKRVAMASAFPSPLEGEDAPQGQERGRERSERCTRVNFHSPGATRHPLPQGERGKHR